MNKKSVVPEVPTTPATREELFAYFRWMTPSDISDVAVSKHTDSYLRVPTTCPLSEHLDAFVWEMGEQQGAAIEAGDEQATAELGAEIMRHLSFRV
jgi:hypothetical protein